MSTATMHKSCIEACYQCLVDCESCLGQMMQMDKMEGSECPTCCRECVQICHLCLSAMARQSRFSAHYCRICTEVCDWCAVECEKMGHDHCLRCAESCRRCAEECRRMAA